MTTVVGTPPGVVASGYKVPPPKFPATLTRLAGWWDAQDASTFSFSGASITQWNDKSPNLLHLAPTSVTPNISRTGSVNAKPAVLMATANTIVFRRASVNVLTLLDAAATDHMMFVVGNFTNPPNNLGIIGTSYRVNWQILHGASTSYLDVAIFPGGRLGGAMNNTASTPVIYAAYRNGANMAMTRNGTTILSKANATTAAVTEVGTLNVLAGDCGNVGEIIMVARYDATDFTNTINYLKTAWGIA